MKSSSRATVLSAIGLAVVLGSLLSSTTAATANEYRYYGAKTCAGNVASYLRTNATNFVDIYQVGGGVAGRDFYQFDLIWRAHTFYSDVKRSSSQRQETYSTFSSAYTFCDN
jgi:hypothetical protein